MTAPRGPIVFNNSTGSDTAASGLGPATAVSGSASAHTGGSASTTITLTNTPDLSGVSAGDMLWLNTASGRQFTVIASVDDGADTVTVDDSFTIDSGSAVDYAIGGKRATLDDADSRTLFGSSGWKAGWSAELQFTGTNYTLTSELSLAEITSQVFVLRASGGRPIVEQTANAAAFGFSGVSSNYYLRLEGIQIINSNGTKTAAAGVVKGGGNTGGLIAVDVIFGDATNQLLNAVSWGGSAFGAIQLVGCVLQNCTSRGVTGNSSGAVMRITESVIRDNGASGVFVFGVFSGLISNCLFHDNAGHGIECGPSGATHDGTISQNIFYNNTSSGIVWSSNTVRFPHVLRNIFAENGAFGIDNNAGTILSSRIDYNAFYSNTSGELDGISNGDNDITLSADPFVDAANGDFNINNDAGGGASLRAATLTL